MGREIYTTGRNTIAAFDFDGTITSCDTLPVFIRFTSTVRKQFFGTLQMLPSLLLFKLKLISNSKAKEKLFAIFFAGMSIENFNQLAEAFIPLIEKKLKPEAMDKIRWHQERRHQVVIVSASAENWIQPWASKYGIDMVLATQLQVKNQVITGKFLTKNCYGEEKVCRLLKEFPNKASYILYAYGDSNGDKELLALADHPYYKSFIDKTSTY
jgi:HAD superfamily hydrolase (TIGR01490 family)